MPKFKAGDKVKFKVYRPLGNPEYLQSPKFYSGRVWMRGERKDNKETYYYVTARIGGINREVQVNEKDIYCE